MGWSTGRVIAIVALMVVAGASNVVVMMPAPAGGVGDRGGMGPFSDGEPVWSDTLDDTSHVYVPAGGLVGIEVTGGEARLKAGATEGWLASEIIHAQPGYTYNIVFLDATVPGNSSIEVSVLDARKESSVVGYANETVIGFEKKVCTERSVSSIDCAAYSELRIQVDLSADGTDRPTLQGWYLYYVPAGEWRDEFLGTCKMDKFRGIELANGTVGIDPERMKSSGGSGLMGYDPYPTVALAYGQTILSIYNPTTDGTSYKDSEQVSCRYASSIVFDDLNGDGLYDLLVGDMNEGTNYVDSRIYWGDSSGAWSPSNSAELHARRNRGLATGDFNGDDQADIVIACSGSGSTTSRVFLNQGDGTFNYEPDIDFGTEGYYPASGDLNGDGYDDIAIHLQGPDSLGIFFGGPDGPSTTPSTSHSNEYYFTIEDIDGDGFSDLIVSRSDQPNFEIFLGSVDGPSSSPDFTLTGTGDYAYLPMSAGDINGDGFIDLIGQTVVDSNPDVPHLNIFEGSSSGWSDADRLEIGPNTWMTWEVVDIDLDGYEDILMTPYQGAFEVWYGGPSFPTSAGLSKSMDNNYAYDIAVAVPRGNYISRGGSFMTEEITLPLGKRWDILDLQADIPKNTSVSISIMDASKRQIAGYKDLKTTNIDLSSIPEGTRSIRVTVSLRTDLNDTTPTLERMTVLWHDDMMWREQFYGHSRIDRYIGVDVEEGALQRDPSRGLAPQLLVASFRNGEGYDSKSLLYVDAGGMDYLTREPMPFSTRGASAVDAADVDGDGFTDIVFAVHQTSVDQYSARSPLFLNSPVGWKAVPDKWFPTTGATDVILQDLNDDGFIDVVFAQETDGSTYEVGSALYWGSAIGWAYTPVVTFATTGASDVEVVDVNGDSRLDLVFACFRDNTSTVTNSLVFLQDATGFCGTVPDHQLPTSGARGVASGDIDGDGHVDLVFANSRSGGLTQIDSYIYWGKAGGGFETTPKRLPTVGARGVAAADLDGDGDLDVVFANEMDNTQDRSIDSYVYLGSGSRTFSSSPDVRLPTTGAVSVTVMDLDGTGWKDLAFACQYDGSSYAVESSVYLGGSSGWSSSPDILLPAEGASDILDVSLFKAGQGGYRSKVISPSDPRNTGMFHTFEYTAQLGSQQSGTLQVVDALTSEVLAETPLVAGTNSWFLGDKFKVKDHNTIQVVAVLKGLDKPGDFTLDDLRLNWTTRIKELPQVLGMELEAPSVYRTQSTTMFVNVTDEYDLLEELTVEVRHRLNGSAGLWADGMFGDLRFVDGQWQAKVLPTKMMPVGRYDIQVLVWDTDGGRTDWMWFPEALEVLNNLPSAPVVRLTPGSPTTDANLYVEIVTPSMDMENPAVTYHYTWFNDGAPFPDIEGDHLPSEQTSKGQNWSVEVRAFDGDDEGPPASAWVVIANAPPRKVADLPDPEFPEDTTDSEWLDLSTVFSDPDGDAITYRLESAPEHVEVTVDPATGKVTLVPDADWFGEVDLTFWANDGEADSGEPATVTVTVLSVNDIPWFETVDGQPVTGGTIEYSIKQGATLTIHYTVGDVEGDDIVATIANPAVVLDPVAGTITFAPGNDQVGTLNFTLTIHDVVSEDERVSIDFSIIVENENDPMGEPSISRPGSGEEFKVNQSFSLIAVCDDPDMQYGQVLNFTWESNVSGVLGYGPSLTVKISTPGHHRITVTVRDPDFTKSAYVEVFIKSTGGGGGGGGEEPDEPAEAPNWLLVAGIVAALVIVGAVLFLVGTRRRAERIEAREEAAFDAEVKREALERTRDALKDAADEYEAEREATRAGEEEIEVTGAPATELSMQAAVTAGPSEEVAKLFAGVPEAKEAVQSEEELEALRIDNLKRKYQNAIGRLPYGIPSKELAERDWVELASALATGEKKTTPGGREITNIDGRWYYSDVKDTGTFLKERGAKKEEKSVPKKAVEPTADKAALLAKLEERFILGEISEEAYNSLKEKYGE